MGLRERLRSADSGGFVRAVGVLVSGTLVAHAVTALAMPVATRLYTPEHFSALAVFMALVSLIASAACLRFDVAIPIPKDDADSANLLALALLFGTISTACLVLLVLAAGDELADWLGQRSLQPYLWLVPVAVFLSCTYSAMLAWFVRKKGFTTIAMNRVAQSCIGASTQIAFGWLGIAPLGLLLGQMLTSSAGGVSLAYRAAISYGVALAKATIPRMRILFVTYSHYPKYSVLETLSNSAAQHAPIIMIAAVSMGSDAGHLLLAMYVMQAPMGLIGSSVSQVFVSRAPDKYREGLFREFTASVVGGLIKSGVGPLLFVGIISPSLFPLVFGEGWARAGVLVQWMTPWFVLQFLASPVSMALHVAHRQRTALALQLFGLSTRVGAVFCASVLATAWMAETYALSGFVFYLVYLIVILRTVAVSASDMVRATRSAMWGIAAWGTAGIAIVLAANAWTH